ncbi:hypothetical protein NYY90_19845, partial [Acinetobacter baumannii]|nr:hypothetical protein [Acinetobacter baumannii]
MPMRLELARLHKELPATMIYVTHDQVEAMTLADKVVVLNSGRIEQVLKAGAVRMPRCRACGRPAKFIPGRTEPADQPVQLGGLVL